MWNTFKMLAVYLGLGPYCGMVGIPYTLLVGDISRFYWSVMWIMAAGVRAAGITIKVEGLDNVPAGRSCIFMSNHVSNLDPPVTIPILPGRTSVLLKKVITRVPIMGQAMLMAKFVPVERGSSRKGAEQTMRAAADALHSGLHILVYPEGTRSRDGRLSRLKKGPFFLAMKTGAPIVPIAISGTQHMMRKGSSAIKPGLATVRMLAPIEPADYPLRGDLMAAVHAALAAALPEEMKPVAGRADSLMV